VPTTGGSIPQEETMKTVSTTVSYKEIQLNVGIKKEKRHMIKQFLIEMFLALSLFSFSLSWKDYGSQLAK